MTSVLTVQPSARLFLSADLTATVPGSVVHLLAWLLVAAFVLIAVFMVKGGGPWDRLMDLLRLLMGSGGSGDA